LTGKRLLDVARRMGHSDPMVGLLQIDGAGNRFLLWDARVRDAPPDAIVAGRLLCDPASGLFEGRGADGLLLVLPPEGDGRVKLVIVNRDGTRPEMCGNGLRCVARYLAEEEASAVEGALSFSVETDAGLMPCRAELRGSAWHVAVRVGSATVGAGFSVPFPGVPHGLPAFPVDVGNPHAVLDASHLGMRLEDAPLEAVAAATLATGRFPAGVNVELIEVHGDHVRARVFERGVGETAACGTGAAAIAAVSLRHLGLGAPVRVHMPGGVLEVAPEEDAVDGDHGALWLAGPTRIGQSVD
jgi:diaminopimelate epimerase